MTTIIISSDNVELSIDTQNLPTRDEVAAYVSGYGYAFDAINMGKIEDRAHDLAQRGGLNTASGLIEDEDEIVAYLVATLRDEIQQGIDETTDALMSQIEAL